MLCEFGQVKITVSEDVLSENISHLFLLVPEIHNNNSLLSMWFSCSYASKIQYLKGDAAQKPI